MRPFSAPADGASVRRSSSSATFEAIRQHRNSILLERKTSREHNKEKFRKMTEAERAYHNYRRSQRSLSLNKWKIPLDNSDDDGFSDSSEERKRDEITDDDDGDDRKPLLSASSFCSNASTSKPYKLAMDPIGNILRRQSSLNSLPSSTAVAGADRAAAPMIKESTLGQKVSHSLDHDHEELTSAQASVLVSREIESREHIIHLLLAADENGPSLRQSLSAVTFASTIRPFATGCSLPRPAAARPASAPLGWSTSTPTSSEYGSIPPCETSSLVESKKQLIGAFFPQESVKRQALTPQLRNAWRCHSNESSDDEIFDSSLTKSTLRTLSLFHHRPVSTRATAVGSAANDPTLQLSNPVSSPSASSLLSRQSYARPSSAPVDNQQQHHLSQSRCSPVALAKAKSAAAKQQQEQHRQREMSSKQILQHMMSQQAADLLMLGESRRLYEVETEAYLSRQRDLQRVLGAVAHAS
jgi:hypothetical protein